MKRPSNKRNERIDIRVSTEFKSLFTRAAEIASVNMSAFIIESARERAVRLIAENERIVLNKEARDVLLNALVNPPTPAEALQRAADKYAMR